MKNAIQPYHLRVNKPTVAHLVKTLSRSALTLCGLKLNAGAAEVRPGDYALCPKCRRMIGG